LPTRLRQGYVGASGDFAKATSGQAATSPRLRRGKARLRQGYVGARRDFGKATLGQGATSARLRWGQAATSPRLLRGKARLRQGYVGGKPRLWQGYVGGKLGPRQGYVGAATITSSMRLSKRQVLGCSIRRGYRAPNPEIPNNTLQRLDLKYESSLTHISDSRYYQVDGLQAVITPERRN
jgi:hypothetical protein